MIQPAPADSPRPSRDAAERKRYHSEEAAHAEKANQHFAAALQLGRLLLDDPTNAALKQRRDAALKRHAEGKGPQA